MGKGKMGANEKTVKNVLYLKKQGHKLFSGLLKVNKQIKKNAGKWRRVFHKATAKMKFLEGENRDVVDRAFDSFLDKVEMAADSIPDDIKSVGDIGIYYFASQKYIQILEFIIEFREAINKEFPGLDDRIIKAAGHMIKATIAYFNPIAALVIEASGISDYIADSLEVTSLKQSVKKMKEKVNIVRADKGLEPLYKIGEAVADIAKEAEIEPEMLVEEVSADGIKQVNEVAVKTEGGDALKILSKCFAKLPSDKAAIYQKKSAINKSVESQLKRIPTSSRELAQKKLARCNEDIGEINRLMHKDGVSMVEKVVYMQQIKERYCKLADELVKDCSKAEKAKMQDIANKLNIEAEKKFAMPVAELQSALAQNAAAKKVAVVFGFNKKVEMQLRRSVAAKGRQANAKTR